MLSAATLQRVSVAYKRGYMDGYNGRPNVGAGVSDQYIKPFAEGDYTEGYKAGENDAKWTKHYKQLAAPRCAEPS